jgi:membrane protein YqaA with SNARE-associated domain
MKSVAAALIAWGPLGIFLLCAIDGAGVPNPAGPDIALLLFAANAPHMAWLAAALAVAGSVLGSLVLFELARRGGQRFLEKHLRGGRGRRFRDWFQRYGLVTVFIPAVVPIPLPLKAFVICSGALGISRTAFALALAVARVPRYFAMAWVGRGLHEEPIEFLRRNTVNFILVAAVLVVVCVIAAKVADRFRAARAR